MATYQNISDGAMVMIGRLASGESPTTAENADALIILNELLDTWSAEIGPVYGETAESLTWATGQATRTIGVSGNLNTARPQKILAAAATISTVDYPIPLITDQEYQAISNKTQTSSIPLFLAYNPTFASSLGTLYMWPVPSSAITLLLTSVKPLTAVSALSGTVTLPPGYSEALRYNLALRYASYFGAQLDPFIVKHAADTKRNLIVSNMEPQPMQMDPLMPGSGPYGDDVRLWTT